MIRTPSTQSKVLFIDLNESSHQELLNQSIKKANQASLLFIARICTRTKLQVTKEANLIF